MEDYPYVTEAPDRHGVVRYRFRRAGKSLYLPKYPKHPEFEEAYRAAGSNSWTRKLTPTNQNYGATYLSAT